MSQAVRRFAAGVGARCSMPLLWKELAESAARPRTYVLRVVYALALYGTFAFILPRMAGSIMSGRLETGFGSSFPTTEDLLGMGSWIFGRLEAFQLWGIILFLPALMCGRITQEKERDSLVLLFLTQLRPWEIVLQKYLGGLVPMLSFLFLSLPLAAVAYALGGLESHAIGDVALGLLFTVLQIGALALMCSAWCRTTVGALIFTYVLGALSYFIPPLLGRALYALQYGGTPYYYRVLAWQQEERWKLLNPTDGISLARNLNQPIWLYLLPSLATIILCLALARWFLVRRAYVPPSNFLPRLFARIDRWMKAINRVTGGIVLYRDSGSLPVVDPVFWRDTQRRVLGKPHYLFRLLCAIEIPTVLMLCFLLLVDNSDIMGFTVALLAGLAVLILSANASNSILSERLGQTFEVLLTTPMSARDIMRQKERALRRLEWVLAVPLLSIFGVHAFFLVDANSHAHGQTWVSYFTCWVLTLAVYLPMITWLSLWIGQRTRSRFQGILTVLGVLVGWALAMPIAMVIVAEQLHLSETRWTWLLMASPVSVPLLNEAGGLYHIGSLDTDPERVWPIIFLNTALYAGIALLIRRHLFRSADGCLRR